MLCVFFMNIFIFLVPNEVQAYSKGAPCIAKDDLQPSPIFHGVSQNVKSNPPPYMFSVENQEGKRVNSYEVGKNYTIRIIADNEFRGILLQPRLATKDRILISTLRGGEFISDDTWESQGIQYQQCQPKTHDSITHTNGEKKTQLEIKWRTLKNVGPVQFYLTLVSEQSIFWEAWQPDTGYLTPSDEKKERKMGDVVAKDDQPKTVTEETKTTTEGPKATTDGPKATTDGITETVVDHHQKGSDLRESPAPKETTVSKKPTNQISVKLSIGTTAEPVTTTEDTELSLPEDVSDRSVLRELSASTEATVSKKQVSLQPLTGNVSFIQTEVYLKQVVVYNNGRKVK